VHIVNLINAAWVAFDNDPESRKPNALIQPIFGITTGVDARGIYDGTLSTNDLAAMIVTMRKQAPFNSKSALHFCFPPCAPLSRDEFFHYDEALASGTGRGHVLIFDEADRSTAVIAKNVRFHPRAMSATDLEIFGSHPFVIAG